jgi:hypothetical protein
MSTSPTAAAKPSRLASDIARPLSLSEKAVQLLSPMLTPRQFFDALVLAQIPDDAIRFLAAALPKREAVGWGVLCVKDALTKPLEPTATKALATAEAWVKDPSEANRRAAEAAADPAGYGTAAGCLAAAAFWSGGSLTPAHLPPVPPRDDLTGTAVVGAILLASTVSSAGPEPAKIKFIAIGGDIASGRVKVY